MKKRGRGDGWQKEKREQENSFEVATLGRRREVFPLGRAHVCMTTTTYDDDDDAAAADDDDVDNGKKLEESKPTVGGVDRGAFPRATSRKVARRASFPE